MTTLNPFKTAAKKGGDESPSEQVTPPTTSAQQDINDVEELLNKDDSALKVQSNNPEEKKIDILPREKVNEIVRQYARKSETTAQMAVIGITAICQAGGTNAGNPSLKRTINGVTFDLKTLREVIEYETSSKGTVRQLAKSMRDVIAKIALANDWPGPLANALVKEFPNQKFNSSDLVYAAEFHDDNRNPEFPQAIAEALALREVRSREARRVQAKQGNSSSGKKNKKKKNK